MKGDDLSNMIIEGESRLKVHSILPRVQWNPEVFKDTGALLQDMSAVSNLKPVQMDEPPLVLPQSSRSQKTASPWLQNIEEAPVLTLRFTPQKESEVKMEWTFLVRDSRGKVFYQRKKKGPV
ncbi:MAG: hypothetical protein IH798_02745, partial [Gemmatimonadetes bacterium]|nr:hypothetical protein [Gemmatimonadota bacterium]